MNLNSGTKYQSVIKFLYMLLILSSLVYATAWAQQTPASQGLVIGSGKPSLSEAIDYCEKKRGKTGDELDQCVKETMHGTSDSSADRENRQYCEKLDKSIDEAIIAYQKACDTMDIEDGVFKPNKGCADRLLENCIAPGKDEMGALAGGAALIGMSRASTKANCTRSSKSYFERKESLEKGIKDFNKEIKDDSKEIANIEKKKSEDIKRIQDAFRTQKEKYEQLKEDLDDAVQQAEEKVQKREVEIAGKLQQFTMMKEQVRENLVNKIAEANSKVIDVSEKMAEEECMIKVKEMYDKLNPKGQKAGSLDASMNNRRKLENSLNQRFQACIQKYDLARQQAYRTIQNLPDQARREIEVYDSQIANLEAELRKLQQDRIKNLAKLDEKKQKALMKAMEDTQALNAELLETQKNARTETMAIGQNLMKNQINLNAKTAELNSLGVLHEGSTNDKSVADFADEFTKAKSSLASFGNGPCCNGPGIEPKKDDKGNIVSFGKAPWYKRCDLARELGKQPSLSVRRGKK